MDNEKYSFKNSFIKIHWPFIDPVLLGQISKLFKYFLNNMLKHKRTNRLIETVLLKHSQHNLHMFGLRNKTINFW